MTLVQSRRDFLKQFGAGAAGVSVGLPFLKMFGGRLRDTRLTVRIPGKDLPSRCSILHLSDFHVSEVVPVFFVQGAVRMGLALEPDLICVTGDMITRQMANRKKYVKVLRELSSVAPTFACLGNHDGGLWAARIGIKQKTADTMKFFAEAGITCLFNEARDVQVGGKTIRLVGLGDYWAGDAFPRVAFKDVPRDDRTPCLLLSHNPDSKEILADYPWDLMLCGHTHGGQLNLPIVGTPFAPVRDHRYVAGLNPWKGRQIYTTRGVGSLYGIRVNCPPEVSTLSITGNDT
ncbi:MAG: phosphodiesterase YaeI [Lentisphaerae bacterium]|nr:phosphodiesterase YaeI [Lentisphaerota bacterium]